MPAFGGIKDSVTAAHYSFASELIGESKPRPQRRPVRVNVGGARCILAGNQQFGLVGIKVYPVVVFLSERGIDFVMYSVIQSEALTHAPFITRIKVVLSGLDVSRPGDKEVARGALRITQQHRRDDMAGATG